MSEELLKLYLELAANPVAWYIFGQNYQSGRFNLYLCCEGALLPYFNTRGQQRHLHCLHHIFSMGTLDPGREGKIL